MDADAAPLGSHTAAGRAWRRLLLTLPLWLLPAPASAVSLWCTWFPWWPGCGVITPPSACGAALTEVTGFGSNPGNLTMCRYVPAGLPSARPLVVALHGCTQQAADYDNEPGWTQFADERRFALLLPQQQQANNGNRCFNWFEAGDTARDAGEALSIRQMIDRTKADLGSDPARVYVTGLSAGGGMTAVMLAAYPDIFAGGAIIAGIPYRCANNVSEALTQCGVSLTGQLAPITDRSPAEWGQRVRNASSHLGPFPRVSIWQGTLDTTVNPEDQRELLDQWTDVLGIDQIADSEDSINGNPRRRYQDAGGNTLVETILINGMGHGTPIDPGVSPGQCGQPAPYILDANVCSSRYILDFWGLDGS